MSRAVKLILGLLMLGQTASAQTAPTEPAAPPTAATPAPPPPPETDVTIRQRPTLSLEDMVRQAREYRVRLDMVIQQMGGKAEQIRKEKDIIRLNCVLDRLAQAKANVAIADSAMHSMNDALGRRDEGGVAHEYSRMTIIQQKVQVLSGEVDACVGEDVSYVGATRVDVDVTGVPPDDFTTPPPPTEIVDRPPVASPYM